jgi:hypothetical protein
MNSSEITDRESQTERDQRNAKIRISQEIIRADLLSNGNLEDPRTKENNAIYPAKTVEEDIKLRQDVVGGQINAWKDILPDVFKKFDKVKDPRRPKSIKHKLAVLLIWTLDKKKPLSYEVHWLLWMLLRTFMPNYPDGRVSSNTVTNSFRVNPSFFSLFGNDLKAQTKLSWFEVFLSFSNPESSILALCLRGLFLNTIS